MDGSHERLCWWKTFPKLPKFPKFIKFLKLPTHAIWGCSVWGGEARARAGRENSTHAIWGEAVGGRT